jgi:hypothetical protein
MGMNLDLMFFKCSDTQVEHAIYRLQLNFSNKIDFFF